MQANSLRFIFYALRVCAPYNADNYYNLDNIDKDYIKKMSACVCLNDTQHLVQKEKLIYLFGSFGFSPYICRQKGF